jgi:DNA primase
MPAGQDPDDVISAGGVQLFQALLSTHISLAEFLWQSELKHHDVSQPEGRARLKEALQAKASTIQHPALRQEFQREFSDRFWDAFRFSKTAVQKIRKSITETRGAIRKNARYVLERAVLLGLSRYPRVVYENEELVTELQLSSRKLENWRNVLIDEIRAKPHLDEDALTTILDASDASPIEKRDLQKDLAFSFFRRMADAETAIRELLQVITVLVAEAKIDAALKEANRRFTESFDEADWADQNQLHKRQAELKEQIAEFRESLAA